MSAPAPHTPPAERTYPWWRLRFPGGQKIRKLTVVMAAREARRRLVAFRRGIRGRRRGASEPQALPNPEVIMKSDTEIERDVTAELQWAPDLDATDIAVKVKNGVAELGGFVRRYTDRYEAEIAAKRVAGVLGIANDIEVRLPSVDERPDPDVARDVVAAMRSQLPISSEGIKAIVRDGWVTLEGEVEWQYQRQTAENAVRRITGVKGVSNTVLLKPHVEPEQVRRKIMEALRRSAQLDASRITVETTGGEVVLKGTVRSWVERDEAERAAWAAPGVTKVDDHIVITP
jgi:osmotically-inducible protein OsmY